MSVYVGIKRSENSPSKGEQNSLLRLVTGSVEISNDRLVKGFSWLVASVKAVPPAPVACGSRANL